MKKTIIRMLAASSFLSVSGLALAENPADENRGKSEIVALDDNQMDQVSAGRISVNSFGGAFSSLGTAFSMTFTEVIMRGRTTILRSVTVSYATGVNATAYSGGSAIVTASAPSLAHSVPKLGHRHR